MSSKRVGQVTFKGNPLTLVGPELQVGDRAPDFTVVDQALNPVHLSDWAGKVVLISAVPSLDTPVCDQQTRRFNELAAQLPEGVEILTISEDLPFAQARWCGAAGIDRVKVLSDYQERDFGLKYGILIEELKLLARSVWIIDGEGVIRYIELVPEVTQLPNFEAALAAVREVARGGGS